MQFPLPLSICENFTLKAQLGIQYKRENGKTCLPVPNPHINGKKKGDVASTQWKEKLPPSLEEVEEKDSKEAL